MGIYTENDKSYTGAGVIVVENYRTFDGDTIPTILIARNKASQTSSDFGGGYAKKHRDIAVTASEELLEESRNLINVSPDLLQNATHFDIEGTRDTYYRVYVIKVQNIASKHYNENKEIIDSDSSSTHQWKETDKIYHVPIDSINFNGLLDRKKVIVPDVHNEDVTFHMRLRKALKNGEEIILDVLEQDPIFTKEDLITIAESEKSFLVGTYQFIAKD